MGDGRQQPENGKGLGFEASARSERRFKTVRAGRTVEALHVSRRIELCCWRIHAASPSPLSVAGGGEGRDEGRSGKISMGCAASNKGLY